MRELIHTGSVKKVFRREDNLVEFEFTDRISVFDMPIPNVIAGKGKALCDMTCFWFEQLRSAGIKNHYVERIGDRSITAERVEILSKPSSTGRRASELIPLEFIARYYVAGMLHDRVQRGEISASQLGFEENQDVSYGSRLPKPFLEMGTKFEAYDRLLCDDEAMQIGGIDTSIVNEIWTMVQQIDALIDQKLLNTSLFHVDGKKEFAFNSENEVMIVDVFGTLDEDRFWDRAQYNEHGEAIELSKEFVRQYYRQIGYKDQLYDARSRGETEPPIPPLSDELVERIAGIYQNVATEVIQHARSPE